MRIQELRAQTTSDLLDGISAFLSTLGWEILERRKGYEELYFKNALGDIYALKRFKMYNKDACLGLFGLNSYDKNLKFIEQDLFYKHFSSQARPDAYYFRFPCAYLVDNDGINLSSALLLANENDLLIRLEYDLGAFGILGINNLHKHGEFEGGALIFSDRAGEINEEETLKDISYGVGSSSDIQYRYHLFAVAWDDYRRYGFGALNFSGEWWALNDTKIPPGIISNLSYFGSKYNSPLAPLDANEVLDIGINADAGLNIMVKPEFFYKTPSGAWAHFASSENFRVISKQNLADLAKIDYGSEKFLILNYGTAYSDGKNRHITPSYLAVRL